MQAYILIQTGVGRLGEVVRDISRVRGVTSAHGVTGAYDVIALAEAPSLRDLGERILGDIERLGGVTKAITCPIPGVPA
jgi:DNA-binding Lrp family transcriptional regulator